MCNVNVDLLWPGSDRSIQSKSTQKEGNIFHYYSIPQLPSSTVKEHGGEAAEAFKLDICVKAPRRRSTRPISRLGPVQRRGSSQR
ncbi:hypothetical protein B0H12DRAFT_1113592 [Mycena haematopus]|nr:hypothetical protein B0H12DRAFT_1113592 [Mycena haematopus]